ncbi:MAG: hypothetical protein ACTSRI_20150 [Promethearchaeota archaeon]
MMISKEPDIVELKEQVIKYLKSKGKIKAVLLKKLENRFCKSVSKIKVKTDELLSCLFLMMTERMIDIIIPSPFQIEWKEKSLKDLKYLKDGMYLTRDFSEFKDFNEDDYYFDSRRLDFNNRDLISKSKEKIKFLIKEFPGIENKIIIYYFSGGAPLNIYEPFEGNYGVNFLDFQVPSQFIKKYSKFEIPMDQQKSDLAIIKSYRNNFMCFYITLIESIQKAILNLQRHEYNKKNIILLKEYIEKFTYYCKLYVISDWVEITEPNPYRWETFFKFFDIPLKILNLSFNSVKFHGRTFEFFINFKYCIFINRNFTREILNLKKLGYQEFKDENIKNSVAIGLNLETFIPCPSIEHFYFLGKYIFFYYLFLLFYHSISYIKKIKPNIKFTFEEQRIYETFFPVMKSLFNIKKNKICKKLVFKYYTFNSDELELIYNKFLLKNVKVIEKKLFKYFFFKYSKLN